MSETTKPTFSEAIETLTGYEEESIAKAFGAHFGDLPAVSTMKRALVYVARKREGLDHAKAKDAAMSVALKEINDFFAPDEEDSDDPDFPAGENGPETEAGKDAAQPE